MPNQRRSLRDVFADLRSKRQIGLLPFIPAGYPDLKTTQALMPAMEQAGASAIEIGIPFSDPIADGPTIQDAFTAALAHMLKVKDIFAAIAEVRPAVSIPLVAMVSYSIVYRYGLERFIADARSAGFDGLIVPDLPPPEAESVCEKIRAGGLDTILLVAPTTELERRREVVSLCSGFVYVLSVSGITGERDKLPEQLQTNLRQLKEITQVPICVGFGISKPEHMSQLAGLADGAIVGSAVVKVMNMNLKGGPGKMAEAVASYCRELLSAVR